MDGKLTFLCTELILCYSVDGLFLNDLLKVDIPPKGKMAQERKQEEAKTPPHFISLCLPRLPVAVGRGSLL